MALNIIKKMWCNESNHLMIFVSIKALKGIQVVLQGISMNMWQTLGWEATLKFIFQITTTRACFSCYHMLECEDNSLKGFGVSRFTFWVKAH